MLLHLLYTTEDRIWDSTYTRQVLCHIFFLRHVVFLTLRTENQCTLSTSLFFFQPLTLCLLCRTLTLHEIVKVLKLNRCYSLAFMKHLTCTPLSTNTSKPIFLPLHSFIAASALTSSMPFSLLCLLPVSASLWPVNWWPVIIFAETIL